MSMQTWLDEFYPYSKEYLPETWEEALETCFPKWEGLRSENLKKHGLITLSSDFYESSSLAKVSPYITGFGGAMCGLCNLSEELVEDTELDQCDVCPMAASRGGTSCDNKTDEEFDTDSDPWSEMYSHKNPEPMIEALKKTKIFMQEHIFNKETLTWGPK